jgi:hypothetical protein
LKFNKKKSKKKITRHYFSHIHTKENMPTSNPLSLIISSTFNKDSKYFFNPFTYKFNFNELKPSLGEPFSYFTQASWTIFSSSRRHSIALKSSDIPASSSSTEITPNERTITIE